MKRRNWFDELTPDEQSMIATCIANGVPLCCYEEGRRNICAITKDRGKRDRLSAWAYGELSCQFLEIGDIERFLNKFLDACGFEPHDMHDEIIAWELTSVRERIGRAK